MAKTTESMGGGSKSRKASVSGINLATLKPFGSPAAAEHHAPASFARTRRDHFAAKAAMQELNA